MARTLSAIYSEILQKRTEHLQLTTFENSSRMSIMNAIMYIMAASIWSLENLIDVFKVDMAKVINNRINGTMAYYLNALKSYQTDSTLEMAEDGCSFHYTNVDPSKRIVTNAVCEITNDSGFYDRRLVFKVATGSNGVYQRVSDSELINIRNYMKQILFAGTNISIFSLKGDVLVPRVLVCYDGSISVEDLRNLIDGAINGYLESTAFTGRFYPSKLINAISEVDHVLDVVSEGEYENDELGIFIAQYDAEDNLIRPSGGTSLVRYINGMSLASGFLREKNNTDIQEQFLSWDDAITVITEDDLQHYTTESVMLTLRGDRINELPTLVVNGVTKKPQVLL